MAYGFKELPKPETLLFKNATVWTNEADGILQNTDVLIKNGKIAQIGKNLLDSGATVIDATGKHLTAGIIDDVITSYSIHYTKLYDLMRSLEIILVIIFPLLTK